MKLNTKQRLLGIFVIVVGVLYFFGQSMANIYLRRELPKIIAQKNDTPYNLDYKEINFTILLGKLSLEGVSITPKEAELNDTISSFKGEIKQISISGVNYWNLIKNHNLKASKITLKSPSFQVNKSSGNIIASKHPSKVTNSINISEIEISDANLNITDYLTKETLVEVFNFNANIYNVHFSQRTKNKPIPFTYKKYKISSDSINAKLNNHLKLHLGTAEVTPEDLVINSVKIRPVNYTKKEIVNDHILTLDVPQIKLSGTDWGYDQNNIFYLSIKDISTSSTKLDILQRKIKTQTEIDLESTKTLSTLIPFNLTIDQIAINNLELNSLDTWVTTGSTILLRNIKNTINQKLHLNAIELKTPAITYFPTPKIKTTSSKLKQITDHILIDSFAIKDASLIVRHRNLAANTLEVQQINSLMQHIVIDPTTISNKVPFTFTQNALTSKKVHYNTNKTYDIYLDSLSFNEVDLHLNNLLLKPKYSREKIVQMNKTAVDIYNLKVNSIVLSNYKWHFDQWGVFNLESSLLTANKLNATIYRDKTPPHDTIYKPLFSQSLRELKFGLNIQQAKILQSNLEYEEYDSKALAPGKLTFANLSANIENIYSGYRQTQLPNTNIQVNASFMNAAPLNVQWSFNILNTSDKFNIKGTIVDFPSDAMQPFLKPYLNVSTSGKIDLVEFNFNGNNQDARGEFGMNYENLQVTLYKKDGKVKRNLLSAVGNLFIRKNTHGNTITKDIRTVERSKEKSFFNYLWLCVLQGLKQTIL